MIPDENSIFCTRKKECFGLNTHSCWILFLTMKILFVHYDDLVLAKMAFSSGSKGPYIGCGEKKRLDRDAFLMYDNNVILL